MTTISWLKTNQMASLIWLLLIRFAKSSKFFKHISIKTLSIWTKFKSLVNQQPQFWAPPNTGIPSLKYTFFHVGCRTTESHVFERTQVEGSWFRLQFSIVVIISSNSCSECQESQHFHCVQRRRTSMFLTFFSDFWLVLYCTNLMTGHFFDLSV